MSLEPTQDAWDGMLWEQEQPIAWLLSSEVNQQPQAPQPVRQDDRQSTDRPLPMPIDNDNEELGYDFDWSKSIPKYKLEAKAAREKNRVLKKSTENPKPKPKSKPSNEMRKLMETEREMRQRLTREESNLHTHLMYHRRDDLEFWQLLERQRKRREDRVRRQLLRINEVVSRPLETPVPE